MRIISQDGMIDFPYEQTIINIDYRDRTIIKAEGCHCDGENSMFTIARYSTEAKACKAMEMLRNAFGDYDWIKTVGNSDELKQFARAVSEEIFDKATSSYFQFPADDKVEG